jgi:hypothetical protein
MSAPLDAPTALLARMKGATIAIKAVANNTSLSLRNRFIRMRGRGGTAMRIGERES